MAIVQIKGWRDCSNYEQQRDQSLRAERACGVCAGCWAHREDPGRFGTFSEAGKEWLELLIPQ